jgi:hypothetical protein
MAKTYTTDTGLFLFAMTVPEKVFSPQEVRGRVLRTLQLYGDKIKIDLEQTVANWNDPAVFNVPVVRYSGGSPRVMVTTKSDKWRWLNEGTAVRWALMDKRFRPKTAPGRWKSGPGAGPSEPVWRGYSMGIPQPGIEPRDWSGQAKKRHKDKLKEALREAIREGMQASLSKGK